MNSFSIHYLRSLLGITLLVFSFQTHGQDVGIGVFVDKTSYAPGQVPNFSVSSFHNEAVDVVLDVHIGVIAPDGTIFEYPDWNTNLQPWLPSFTIPANFKLPATLIGNLSNLPGGLQPGVYQAAAALMLPGTFEIVALDIVPFSVTTDAVGGSSFGALSLLINQSNSGSEVTAGGVFYSADFEIDQLVNNVQGTEPNIDQCVFNEIPLDFSVSENGVEISTLDAGDSLSLEASNGSTEILSKLSSGDALGLVVYTADPNPPLDFYQGGESYTVVGTGGSQVSDFAVSAVAPGPINVTQPNLNSFDTLNTQQDLAILWSDNNGIGEIRANISGTTLSTLASITCRFADDGQGSIPSNLLIQLRDTLSTGSTTIPKIPGIELPDDKTIQGLGNKVAFSLQRANLAFFDTSNNDLDLGVFTISAQSGASPALQ